MSKRILITGVNGQVGNAIMDLKHDYPFKIIPVTRSIWDMAKEPEKIKTLVKQYQPDVVINTAAYTNVDEAEDDHDTAYAVNATAVGLLAKACQQNNIPLLHISTDYVFDGTKETPYTENDPINPINVYGKSKAEGERLIRKVLDKHIILRTSWIFSKGYKNFVTTIRRLGKNLNELKVINDQRGGPTSADCIAKVLMDIACKNIKGIFIPWGTYHYSGSPAVSRYEFAEAIFEAEKGEKRPILISCCSTEFQTKAVRPKNSVMCTESIKDMMGILDCNWKNKLAKDLSDLYD